MNPIGSPIPVKARHHDLKKWAHSIHNTLTSMVGISSDLRRRPEISEEVEILDAGLKNLNRIVYELHAAIKNDEGNPL